MNDTIPPPTSQSTTPAQDKGGSTALLIMLAVVIVLVVGLMVAVGMLAVQQASLAKDLEKLTELYEERSDSLAAMDEAMGMGMPTPEQMEVYSAADETVMEAAYAIQDADTDAYLALYEEGDEHVDLQAAEAAFSEAVEAADDAAEYVPGMYSAYTDIASGETVLKARVESMSMTTGAPAGKSLTLWVVVDAESGIARLTGDVDRDLERDSSFAPY